MLRKFNDWEICGERSVLFANVCTLMHNLSFTWQNCRWSFQCSDSAQLEDLINQPAIKMRCRLDNVHCQLYFLKEDAMFFLSSHYEADLKNLATSMQKVLFKQAISNLLTVKQNTFLVQDVEFYTMTAGAMRSNQQYLCAPFHLFINDIRLRGLMKLAFGDVHKWYRFYQKHSHLVQDSNLWQDVPLEFAVLLGGTEFELANFLQDKFDIREHDVIVIENAPPQGCVWIDVGGYLLLARYEQQKFILEEDIMPENKDEKTRPQENPDAETMAGPEEDISEDETAEDEEGLDAETEDEMTEEEPEEAAKVASAKPADASQSSEEEDQETMAEDEAEDNTAVSETKVAENKLPEVLTNRLSRASLNTAIKKMSVQVVFELSRVQIPLSDLQKLNKGYVFNLHQKSDMGINIIVNEKVVARGELVKISDSLGVRITKVF